MFQARDGDIEPQRNRQLTKSAKLNGQSGGSESTERVIRIIVRLSDGSLAVTEDQLRHPSVHPNAKKRRSRSTLNAPKDDLAATATRAITARNAQHHGEDRRLLGRSRLRHILTKDRIMTTRLKPQTVVIPNKNLGMGARMLLEQDVARAACRNKRIHPAYHQLPNANRGIMNRKTRLEKLEKNAEKRRKSRNQAASRMYSSDCLRRTEGCITTV